MGAGLSSGRDGEIEVKPSCRGAQPSSGRDGESDVKPIAVMGGSAE